MTLRALLVGLLLAFAVGAAGPYCTLYLQGSNAGDVFYTSPMAHLFFFVLVGGINALLAALRRPWALSRSELIGVYILMTLANSTHTLAYYWVAILAGPFYYATPEKNWVALIQPHIPAWLAPVDLGGVRLFFEGAQAGSEVPWQVWLTPLLGWLPLFVALHAGSLCLMVILRRQWAERERISYPLVQVPLAMLQEEGRSSLFRSGAMWAGFALPVVVGSLQGLHNYYPFVPALELRASIPLLPNAVELPLILSFATLGFFFLAKREVSFGLWVFYLLNTAQKAAFHLVGAGGGREPAVSVWSYDLPSLVHQNMGAMIMLVLGGLWVGREHLRQFWNKAVRGDSGVDDQDEVIGYRGAVCGLAGSALVLGWWLWGTGIPLVGVLGLLFFVLVVFVALTQVIAEGGVAVLYPPLVAPDAALSALGTPAYGAAGLVGMVFTRVWANDVLNFAMPHCANGLKLGEQVEGRRPWLFWGMLAGTLAGLTGALWMLLHLAYTYGAINLRPAHFIWLPEYVFDYAAARINEPSGPDLWGWVHTGIGAGVMGLLLLARRLWSWWPLRPLGYPISSVFSWMSFNAFLAWLIKGIALRYGGVRLYREVRPFFLGLIIGQFAVFGVFWVIDSFTGMVGNSVLV
ncbi:MAG: hypothetical protein FJY95_00760 [Candidatus Handelsmanbacteria bacterium]|nr:hypothetical protein [Candidatus Handelsmanbacteria bacterium]